ncbi:hypothetical protein [Deinococcus navajonensis]|uniref:Uncharacterized protein n=1 Tax=Deinococcus navajonensis TaxID=309884 RepID=A0ABV8XNP9_9DEIO
MRKMLLALSALMLGGASATEVAIPNTQVSYEVTRDPITDRNTSSIYIDAQAGDTYVEFDCRKGLPVFYLFTEDQLMTQDEYDEEAWPDLTYRVDNQTARTIPGLSLEQDEDPDDETHLMSLVVEDKNDALIFTAFKNAQTRVALRVTRANGRELTYVFAVKGFAQALKAVNNCK